MVFTVEWHQNIIDGIVNKKNLCYPFYKKRVIIMNIAIVDDDINFLNIVKSKLLNLDYNLSISCIDNPYDFLENINLYNYVLLDIDLPGIDGITISKQLRKNDISIFL